MAYIDWTSTLDLPNEKINAQHRELVARVNALHDAFSDGKSTEELVDVIVFLVNYMGEHFSDEERMMEAAGYPEAETHKAEHTKLFELVERRTERYMIDGDSDSEGLLSFLKTWLIEHVLGLDLDLAAYLQQKGEVDC